MALAPRTTRDGNNQTFSINFEDNGNPSGPQTPVSGIVGDALTALQTISANTSGTLRVEFAAPQPVVDGTASLVFTTASGTSTGLAIALLPANVNRRAFQFQNASDTDFTVNFDGTASASAGFLVAPGKLLEFYGAAAPKGAVSIFCGANAKRYVCRVA